MRFAAGAPLTSVDQPQPSADPSSRIVEPTVRPSAPPGSPLTMSIVVFFSVPTTDGPSTSAQS